MRIRSITLLPLALLVAFGTESVRGGTPVAPSSKQPVVAAEPAATSPLWEVTVRPYGWLAGVDGTVGIKGFTAEADMPFKDILSNLDMVAALQLEVRRERWMLLLDGLYLKLSGSTETPGRLLSTVGVEIEELTAEAALGYRVWEGKRGYLDVFAGVRYMYMSGDLSFNLDSDGVRSFSEDLSRAVVGRVGDAVRRAVTDALPELMEVPRDRLASAAEARIRQRVDAVVRNNRNLGKGLLRLARADARVGDAIRELVSAEVAAKQEGLEGAVAAASDSVAAAKAQGRERLSRAVARAEKKLARVIESAIENTIPDRVSGTEDWLDPFIGFRGRFNITDRFYAVGRADIGGFGVGSDLAWQVYAGLGWQMTPHATVEVGYRALDVDYHSGGFTYDTTTAGIFLGLGYTF